MEISTETEPCHAVRACLTLHSLGRAWSHANLSAAGFQGGIAVMSHYVCLTYFYRNLEAESVSVENNRQYYVKMDSEIAIIQNQYHLRGPYRKVTVSFRQDWSPQEIPDQARLQSEIVSKTTKSKYKLGVDARENIL